MTSTGPTRPYRLSDQEREEAMGALADAFAAGRLDAGEFDFRVGAAAQAVYAHDLDPLFADLLGPRTPRTGGALVPAAGVPGRHGRRTARAPRAILALAMMVTLAGTAALVLLAVGALVASGAWLVIPVIVLVMHLAGPRRRAVRGAYSCRTLAGPGRYGQAMSPARWR